MEDNLMVLMYGLLLSVSLLFQSGDTAQLAGVAPISGMKASYQEKDLLEKLQDDTIWADPRRDVTLMRLLQAAQEGRFKSLAPVLVKHIGYSPFVNKEHGLLPKKYLYPAADAVEKIGLPAVAPLLSRLKSADPDTEEDLNIIVHALINIYDKAGNGQELARLRIQLEYKAAMGKQRVSFLKALAHPDLTRANPYCLLRPPLVAPAPRVAEEKELLVKLQDEKIWADPKQEGTLLLCLKAAQDSQFGSLAPVLAKHIGYSPYAEKEHGLLNNEDLFPAADALEKIGLPAVDSLLMRLKSVNPGEQRTDHNLCVHTLILIYCVGGSGKELARLRIELESQAAMGQERQRLLYAVHHPHLQ